MLFNFIPKEFNFFDLFEKQIDCAIKAAIHFKEIVAKGTVDDEALKKIKEIDKDIVVIMVTGQKDDRTIKQALDAGADDYITKPLSLEYLDKVVLLKMMNLQLRDISKDMSNF